MFVINTIRIGIGRLLMSINKDKAVGFYIYSNGVKWELVESCTYRRAMQIIINRIGSGDVY